MSFTTSKRDQCRDGWSPWWLGSDFHAIMILSYPAHALNNSHSHKRRLNPGTSYKYLFLSFAAVFFEMLIFLMLFENWLRSKWRRHHLIGVFGRDCGFLRGFWRFKMSENVNAWLKHPKHGKYDATGIHLLARCLFLQSLAMIENLEWLRWLVRWEAKTRQYRPKRTWKMYHRKIGDKPWQPMFWLYQAQQIHSERSIGSERKGETEPLKMASTKNHWWDTFDADSFDCVGSNERIIVAVGAARFLDEMDWPSKRLLKPVCSKLFRNSSTFMLRRMKLEDGMRVPLWLIDRIRSSLELKKYMECKAMFWTML